MIYKEYKQNFFVKKVLCRKQGGITMSVSVSSIVPKNQAFYDVSFMELPAGLAWLSSS